MNSNYLVKTTGAKLADIKKALSDAGIEIRSIMEVYKEEAQEAKKD